MKERLPIIGILVIVVFMYFVGVAVGLSSREEQYDINVPTCAELDNVGYDGLATCVDANGDYQTPGR